MYKGLFTVGGTEVVNVARTMAYIAAGYGQPGVDFDTPVAYEGVGEALGETYRTPVLDEAPWFDAARPETWGFAGVLPLSVDNLDGTTRAAAVVENIGPGGVVQKARRGTRTIPVSALLVGDSAAAVDAGLDWLTSVLERTCEDPGPAQLSAYKVKPCPVDGEEDTASPLVDAEVAASADWTPYGGTWVTGTATFTPTVAVTVPVEVLNGGTPATGGGAGIDGGTPAAAGAGTEDGGDPTDPGPGSFDGGAPIPGEFVGDPVDGGDAEGGSGFPLTVDGGDVGGVLLTSGGPINAHIAAPLELGCLSRVEVTWTVTPGDAPVRVQAGASDAYGVELARDPEVHLLTDETTFTWTVYLAPWEDWRPTLWVAGGPVEVALSVARRGTLDGGEALARLRRTYARLNCIDGPRVVGDLVADDDADVRLVQVEWTWVAGDPYRYTEPVTLLAGLNVTNDTAAVSSATGVSYANEFITAAAGLVCAEPVEAPSCGYDPLYPGFVAPPTAPVVADPGATNPTNYHRRVITLEPAVTPDQGALALRWTLANPGGTALRGIRVRLWRQDDPDFATHDECGFESEFWVNYIDAGATLIVDGIAASVTAVCDDDSLAPAIGVMRGPYRGAFDYPVLACTGTYFIAVDTPSTMSGLLVSVDAAIREG